MRLAAPHGMIAPALDASSILWEECVCQLCDSADWTPLLEAADPLGAGWRFLLVKCNRCGLCFTNPRPGPFSIKQFYPADYPCHHGKRNPSRGEGWPLQKLPIDGLARLLDFGCGAGDFLRRMHALGWNVTGLDVAEAAIERIRAQGLTAHAGTLPNPRWSDPCFEAITMWQSLEHVHQPLEVLRSAHRLLTPGGRLLISVPNLDSFASRWFGPCWFGLDVPRHLTHFTPQTLRLMLERAGFEQVELHQQQRHSWIRHSAELAAQRHSGSLTHVLRTRLGSAVAGWWGRLAGRAESILALAIKS